MEKLRVKRQERLFIFENRPRIAIAASLSCSSISQGFKRAYSGMSLVQPILLYKPRGSISFGVQGFADKLIVGLGVRLIP